MLLHVPAKLSSRPLSERGCCHDLFTPGELDRGWITLAVSETRPLCANAASLIVRGLGPTVTDGDKTSGRHRLVVRRWRTFRNPLRNWGTSAKSRVSFGVNPISHVLLLPHY